MARYMVLGSTGVYRTVVTTTFVKDYKKPYGHTTYHPGDVVTEIFGPHVSNANNRNYSTFPGFYSVDDGFHTAESLRYSQEKFDLYYKNRQPPRKWKRIPVSTQKVEHQILKPVLALNASGSLELALDWVAY